MATTHLPKAYKKIDNSGGTAPLTETIIDRAAFIKKLYLTNHGTSDIIVTLKDGNDVIMDVKLPASKEYVLIEELDVSESLKVEVPVGAVVSVTAVYTI